MKREATILVEGAEPAAVASYLAARFETTVLPDSLVSGEEPYGYTVSWPNWSVAIEPDAIDFGIEGYTTTVLFIRSNRPDPGQVIFKQLASAGWKVALTDVDANNIVRESKPASVA